MKKLFLFLLVGLMSLTGFSQRFKVATYFSQNDYKKHYSHSIEGGIENNQLRQFVAGNVTDWGYYNKKVTGHPIDGVNFLPGTRAELNTIDERGQLTDFTIYPTDDYQYGAGTGVYYPNGSGGNGYPFYGKYDKVTMEIIDAWYYNITYPNAPEPVNAVGLRIVYSHVERAFYISGVMADRLFEDVNMNNIIGKSKGFILKIDETGLNPQVLVFEPDNLPNAPYDPILCAVTDLEISADESEIAFTGMTTKETGFDGYYHPMVGIIDMDLNVQWSNVYNFPEERYSGIDVEYNTTDDKLLVLLNSARYPFAMMELDYNGLITQQPVNYVFDAPFVVSESARAHKMHYANGEIIITGNCFVEDNSQPQTIDKQLLFSYEIPNATNLLAGNNYFESYSTEVVPLGSQKAVTGYWAPENSIYQDGNLSIVGIYNNDPWFGYTLIQMSGFVNNPGCMETGEVSITGFASEKDDQVTSRDDCIKILIPNVLNSPVTPDPIPDCQAKKSVSALGNGTGGNGNFWHFKGIDAQGIHAVLISENSNAVYEVNVCDVVGRKIFSSTYKVSEGQSEIYLEFATKAEMYIISVSNGSQTEILKVMGNR